MSNYLAPATVTAALRTILIEGLAADNLALGGLPVGTNVVVGRPDQVTDTNLPQINIYLYQVAPNTQWRNHDLPTRNERGHLARSPRAAIDLHFLLTFFGTEAQLEPQRIMGSVVHLMNDEPVLTRPRIEAAIAGFPFLANSDLANEIERVKFTPIAYSLEELSKLWSVFFNTTYSLSIAYSASVVFVEAVQATPVPLPVQERQVVAIPSATATPAPAPDQIDGLALWLVSDREITFDVDGVSAWNDLSGHDNHAMQAASALRPALAPHGLWRRPVVRFDGVDDVLNLTLTLTAPLDGLTVALIVRMTRDDSQISVAFGGFGELRVSDGGATPRPTWETTDTTAAGDVLTADRTVNDTNWHAVVSRFAAGETPDKQIFIDGRPAGETTAHGGSSLGIGSVDGQLSATSGSAPAGDVAELIIYDRALDDNERELLERYFANRYG